MRLTSYEIEMIKKSFFEVFKSGKIYLFGSRIDDSKRGGDIDLFIELSLDLSAKEIMEKKSAFKLRLYNRIGEQKIDVIISTNKQRSIEKEALSQGILL